MVVEVVELEPVEGYWLDYGDGVGWRRVTRAEYVLAERAAGYRRNDTTDDVATRSFLTPRMIDASGSPVAYRGTLTDPNKQTGLSNRELTEAEPAARLRRELRRERERVQELTARLRRVEAERDQHDREVLARAAPALLQKLVQAVVQDLTSGD